MIIMKQFVWENGELVEENILEVTWDALRSWRNGELIESDWRFTSDQTPSQEWIDYRSFLRDLPQNYETANEAWTAFEEYIKPE